MAQHGPPDHCSNFLINADNRHKHKTSQGGVGKEKTELGKKFLLSYRRSKMIQSVGTFLAMVTKH